jgi:hypothetical protein
MPGPGFYDSNINTIGKNCNKITLGGKYLFKPDSNPAVGTYDPKIISKPKV